MKFFRKKFQMMKEIRGHATSRKPPGDHRIISIKRAYNRLIIEFERGVFRANWSASLFIFLNWTIPGLFLLANWPASLYIFKK